MALHLNLLHEEILEHRQRKRDPLKIGMMVLAGIGVLLFLYYMWNAYRTLEIKRRLSAVQADWAKVEPKITAAQKKAAELNGIISTTRVLDEMIANRFYWAPFLEHVARCVAPNTQLTGLDGAIGDDKLVHVSIEGVAAGREARAAAEDLRQLVLEQLGKNYSDVKVEFKTLEDLDTIVNVAGVNMPMARFVLTINFDTPAAAKATAATPAPLRKKKS
jgi:hypothetical protein